MSILDLIFIHYVVIDEYFSEFKEESADHRGIVNVPMFLSALYEPQQTFGGQELYPDVLIKGAAYLRSFALNHAFSNGNKRTAILATIIFLEMNGYKCEAEQNKLIRLARTVVIQKLTPKQIREKFLKKYFKPAERRKRRTAYIEENQRPILEWLTNNFDNLKNLVKH